MELYAKELTQNGICMVGFGDDVEEFTKLGFTKQDVTFNKLDNNYYLTSKFDIETYNQKLAEERENNFKQKFFYIANHGWYRKEPKGYSNAVESIIALNMFYGQTGVPKEVLTFYKAPDFTQEEQCTEEWLVANSYKNNPMTAEELRNFVTRFMTAWNNEEHK